MQKLAKIALVATVLAFISTRLPFKAHIDVPIFYVTSLGALLLAVCGAASGVRSRPIEKAQWAWLTACLVIAAFWIWFWGVSLNKHVG